jgi:hypothetical protein
MDKVLWNTMMSLDGFIAGPNDDMQWVFGVDGGAGQMAGEIVRSTGALLVGRRTQDVEDRLQPGFYGGAFRGPFFVLRHDPPPEPPVVKGVTGQFLDVGIDEAVRVAKDAATSSSSARTSPDSALRQAFLTRSSCTSLPSSSAMASAFSSAPAASR